MTYQLCRKDLHLCRYLDKWLIFTGLGLNTETLRHESTFILCASVFFLLVLKKRR